MQINRLLFPLLLCLAFFPLRGQTSEGGQDSLRQARCKAMPLSQRIASHSHKSVSLFSDQRVDTYLSPLTYTGAGFSFDSYEEGALSQRLDRWLLRQQSSLYISLLENPARTAMLKTYGGSIGWDALYRLPLPYNIRGAIGALSFSELTLLDQSRNQNNPIDVELTTDLGISGLVAYRLVYKKFVCDFRLSASASLVGLAFSPDYRESYLQALIYEKWSKNIHPTLVGLNRHSYRLGGTIEIPIARFTTFVLGVSYWNSATLMNGLFRGRQQTQFSIGFSTDLLFFRGKELMNHSYIQPALWNTTY